MVHEEVGPCVRALLHRPLLLAKDDADCMRRIVRHRHALANWFGDHLGWRLIVDPYGHHARLFKVNPSPDCTRPARYKTKTFTRRHYVLFCQTLACLDDGSQQTTLARIVEHLAAAQDTRMDAFDALRITERRTLTDVLRLLQSLGVLTPRDGDLERYGNSAAADALFDVEDRIIGQLIATPLPPAAAGTLQEMLTEPAYADTEEGRRQRARHNVMRRLLEDPVVLLHNLQERERSWIEHNWGYIKSLLHDQLGLSLERRAEGSAVIDPTGGMTDVAFPSAGSSAKHAALIICAAWCEGVRRGESKQREIASLDALIAGAAAQYAPRWSRAYAGESGLRALTREAIGILHAMHLVRPVDGGLWEAQPMMARFATPSNNERGYPS